MPGTKSLSNLRTFAVIAAVLFAARSFAADAPAVKPEELFPETTFLAASIPDMEAARKAAAGSRFGEIFKQPDVRAFLDPVLARIAANYAECRAAEPRLPAIEDLDKAVFTGESSVCVYSKGARAEPGFVYTFKPKDAKAFDALTTPLLNRQPLPVNQIIPLGVGDAAPAAFYTGERLLVGKPMSDLELVVARITDVQKRSTGTLAASAGFKDSRAAIGATQAWLFINPAPLMDLAEAAMKGQKPSPKAVFKAAGLDKISGLLLGLDFAGGEPVSQGFLGVTGTPSGLLGLVGTKAVRKDVFQIVADNAPYVAAGSFQFSRLIPTIREIAAAVDPQAGQIVEGGLAQVNEKLQFDLQKDLLDNIEPDMAYAQTNLETGAPLSFSPGMVGMLRVKNGAKVEECLKKTMSLLSALLPLAQAPEFMARLGSTTYKGSKLYYMSQLLNGSYCLAVIKDNLIVGNSVNAVKRGIDQLGTGSSILTNKTFQTAIARISGKPFDAENLPVSLAYSIDNGSGNGILLLSVLGLSVETAAVAGLAEGIHRGEPVAEDPGTPPYLHEIVSHPGGKVALNISNAIDWNLWPDEAYFAQYRLPHASIGTWSEKGWLGRSELPPPMPTSGINSATTVAVVAIVAAIAVPNLLRSRMAANEVAGVAACKAYCTAQDIYRRTDYNKDGVLEYAQALNGANSLYETEAGAGDVAMIDRSFAMAEGNPGKAIPKAGYCFKVLTKQGANASGGARNYVVGKHMTLGYALVAYPAQYDGTGRNTFLVNNAGVIYQKDMGAETHAIIEKMTEFNPDNTWVIAE